MYEPFQRFMNTVARLVYIETNLITYVEKLFKYLMQVYISQKSRKYFNDPLYQYTVNNRVIH